jgi:predicted amidohydrolase
MAIDNEFILGAAQAAPVYFDREASTDKACKLIQEAGKMEVDLLAFGETWLPGYPFFHATSYLPEGRVRYLENAVEIPSPTTERLCDAAREAKTDVAIGVAELDPFTRGSTYCTLLFIGREGKILGRHRKLKPTDGERRVWGEGDGAGLVVYNRPYAKISGLNCWEHRMLLPGYTLMALGTQVHVAAWPFAQNAGPRQLMSRAFAAQGACYVIETCALAQPEDVTDEFRDVLKAVYEMWGDLNAEGCAKIINPRGHVVAEAPIGEESIVTAPASLDKVRNSKGFLDVGGHYSRPDVFRLLVNRRPFHRAEDMNSPGSPLAPSSEDWTPVHDESTEEGTKDPRQQ